MDACNYVDFPALHGSYCRSSYSKLRVLHAVGPCRKPAVPVDHTKLLCMIRIISTTLISPLTQSRKNKTVSGVSEMFRLRREEAERPAGKEGKIGGRGGDCMRMDEWEESRNSQPLSASRLAMLTLTNFKRGPAQRISQCLANPPHNQYY